MSCHIVSYMHNLCRAWWAYGVGLSGLTCTLYVTLHVCLIHFIYNCACLQTFVSRTRLAVQRAEDMTATPFEEDNISVVPSDQGQAPGQPLPSIRFHHPLCMQR